jgi:hypothetical protein
MVIDENRIALQIYGASVSSPGRGRDMDCLCFIFRIETKGLK